MTDAERMHAEKSVLGALLLCCNTHADPCWIAALKDTLTPDDFSEERHQLLYSTLCVVYGDALRKLQELHAGAVIEKLRQYDEYLKVGGAVYLAHLATYCENVAHAGYYATQLIQNSTSI